MSVVINAEKRNEELNPRQVRAEGKLTATVYGKGKDSVSVQLNEKEFMTAYNKNKDTDFDLKVDKTSYKVRVQDIQKNYRTGQNLNVQFVIV